MKHLSMWPVGYPLKDQTLVFWVRISVGIRAGKSSTGIDWVGIYSRCNMYVTPKKLGFFFQRCYFFLVDFWNFRVWPARNDETDNSKWHIDLNSTQPNISIITYDKIFLYKTSSPPFRTHDGNWGSLATEVAQKAQQQAQAQAAPAQWGAAQLGGAWRIIAFSTRMYKGCLNYPGKPWKTPPCIFGHF